MNQTLRSLGRYLPIPIRTGLKKLMAPAQPIISTFIPDNKLHFIDPILITNCCADDSTGDTTEFDIYQNEGKVIPGNWDIGGRPFKDLDIYLSTQMRLEGIPWQHTPFYIRVAKIIQAGHPYFGCVTLAALDDRCLKWNSMIESMKQFGYQPKNTTDEICVNISRSGQLLFNNGRHRLAAAQLLQLSKVAIRITVQHPEWIAFRDEILTYATEHNQRVYAPLMHPDLENISCLHTHERYDLISAYMSPYHKTLLDIGAHWGYFCIRFAREGMDCTAVEQGNLNTRIMMKMRDATGTKFGIYQNNIFNIVPLKYNAILALSIFHHFLLKKDSYAKFLDLLHRMDCQELFVEMHNPKETQMQQAHMKLEPIELASLITRESKLKCSKKIGETTDNEGLTRPIYKFWR